MKRSYIVIAQHIATFISSILNNIFLSPYIKGRGNLSELIKLKEENELAVIFISNHTNASDPFVETGMFSLALKKQVFPITFLAAHEKFTGKVKSFFMRLLGCIPVADGKGGNVREVIRLIKSSETIYLFPEGTVSLDGNLGKDVGAIKAFSKFTAMIIQPVFIEGLKPFWDFKMMLTFHRNVKVTFGKPFILKRGSDIDAMEVIARLKVKEHESLTAAIPQTETGE